MNYLKTLNCIPPNSIREGSVVLHDVTSEAQDVHLICSCYHTTLVHILLSSSSLSILAERRYVMHSYVRTEYLI